MTPDNSGETTVRYRTCPLCEATCGLELTMRGREIVRVRGDRDDVFSKGYICPKGAAIRQLDNDPDRIRRPLVKVDGEFVETTWDEAFARVAEGLGAVLAGGQRDAVAAYLGNPSVHNTGLGTFLRVLVTALGTTNVYSASTVDQMPKQVSAGLMFGTALTIAVPDLDRTDHLIILGANPLESNGSLLTAPDMPGRLEGIRGRGGRVVVIDPRRLKTAEAADEHVSVRPGADPYLLMGMVHTLFDEDLVDLGDVGAHVGGLEEMREVAKAFPPEDVAAACGVAAPTIRRLARELAAAPTAAVYARIGTCTAEFGTLAQWLVDVLNVLTGNLDRAGGAMFPKAIAAQSNSGGAPGVGRGVRFGRRHSRVRGLPEFFGEFPVVCLAEEITTPGEGQVRALVTVAGNPVMSTPHSDALDAALDDLDFMVSVDIYVNETTRHADVILPSPSLLTKGHMPIAFQQLSVRNVAHWSPPAIELDDDERSDEEIMLRLGGIAAGLGADADIDVLDDLAATQVLQRAVASEHSNVHGRDVDELMGILAKDGRTRLSRLLDAMVRTGPFGDGFGAIDGGLTLAALEAAPHGIDFGPLEPRMPDVLRTPSGKIELAPEPIVADVERLRDGLAERAGRNGDAPLLLVGRRHLRSNNSWMHNVGVLVSGPDRCTAQLHPDDAARLGVVDGAPVRVVSRVGEIEVVAEVTDAVAPGVVSIPHGWGHSKPGIKLATAQAHPGVNVNVLADPEQFDPLSGNAVLNGIPVTVAPAVPA